MTSEREDAYLVQATLDGDEEAYGELARRHRKAAFGVALSRLGDYDAALDAAQEALVAAYMQLPLLREPGRFAAWLSRIANNVALMRLRGRRPTLSLESPLLADLATPETGPSEFAERLDVNGAVREALSQLPEIDRSAVILHYVSGYSHEEIAEMLGVSASSVKARLFRARRRLRRELINTMETMGERLPDVEITEEFLEGIVKRFDCGEHGVIAHLGGFAGILAGMSPQFTEKTKEAIRRIADRLREEGCSRLYAVPQLPDGSPALAMFRSLGFETETELREYVRDLTTGLPAVPPLPAGFEVRRAADASPEDILALIKATTQKHAPDAVGLQWVKDMLQGPHRVCEASLAAYEADRLAMVLWASGCTSWELWAYEPGFGMLWGSWDTESIPSVLLAHLIGASLKGLKKVGLNRAVMNAGDPNWEYHRSLAPVLERLGFAHVRSLWNLRLPLKGGNI